MDLVNFTEGVQSVRIQHTEQASVNHATAKRFIPLGESVIEHTEKLFTIHTSGRNPFGSLILPRSNTNIDPQAYDTLATATYKALHTLHEEFLSSHQTDTLADKTEQTTNTMNVVRQALAVLNQLKQDRYLLQTNLTALEKV